MANIDEYLNQIRSAIYGEEVRGSIVNAITAMNNESSQAKNEATTAEDQARASADAAKVSEQKAAQAEAHSAKIDKMTVSASKLSAGENPTVGISDDGTKKHLTFGIPKGDTGVTPRLRIGTVSTGQPGTDASATITGTLEDPVLNLVIPEGQKGKVDGVPLSNTPAKNLSANSSSGTSNEVSRADHVHMLPTASMIRSVSFESQTLTEEQKEQARLNIGIEELPSSFVTSVNGQTGSVYIDHLKNQNGQMLLSTTDVGTGFPFLIFPGERWSGQYLLGVDVNGVVHARGIANTDYTLYAPNNPPPNLPVFYFIPSASIAIGETINTIKNVPPTSILFLSTSLGTIIAFNNGATEYYRPNIADLAKSSDGTVEDIREWYVRLTVEQNRITLDEIVCMIYSSSGSARFEKNSISSINLYGVNSYFIPR